MRIDDLLTRIAAAGEDANTYANQAMLLNVSFLNDFKEIVWDGMRTVGQGLSRRSLEVGFVPTGSINAWIESEDGGKRPR